MINFEPFKATDTFTMQNFNEKLGGAFDAVNETLSIIQSQIKSATPIVKLKEVSLSNDATVMNVDLSDVDLSGYERLRAICQMKQSGNGIQGLRFNEINSTTSYSWVYKSEGTSQTASYIQLANWDSQLYSLDIFPFYDIVGCDMTGLEKLTNASLNNLGINGICLNVGYNQLTSFSIGLYKQHSSQEIGVIPSGSKITLYGLKYPV